MAYHEGNLSYDLKDHLQKWIHSAVVAWENGAPEQDLELEARIGRVYSRFASERDSKAAYLINERSARMYHNDQVYARHVDSETGAVNERFGSSVGTLDCMDRMITNLESNGFIEIDSYKSITIKTDGELDSKTRLVYQQRGKRAQEDAYYREVKKELSAVMDIATPIYAYDVRLATNTEVKEKEYEQEEYNRLVAQEKETRGTSYQARLRKRRVFMNLDMREWEVHCTHVKVYNTQKNVVSQEFEVEIEMTKEGTQTLKDEMIIGEYVGHLQHIIKDVLLAPYVPMKRLPYYKDNVAHEPVYGIGEPMYPWFTSISESDADTVAILRSLCQDHVVYPRSNMEVLRRSDLPTMDKSSYVVWNTPVGMPALLLRFQNSEKNYDIHIVPRDQSAWTRPDLDGQAHEFFTQFGNVVMDVDIVWNPIKKRMMLVVNDVYVLTDLDGKSVQVGADRKPFESCDFNERIAHIQANLKDNDALVQRKMMPIITLKYDRLQNIRNVAAACRDGWHVLPVQEADTMNDMATSLYKAREAKLNDDVSYAEIISRRIDMAKEVVLKLREGGKEEVAQQVEDIIQRGSQALEDGLDITQVVQDARKMADRLRADLTDDWYTFLLNGYTIRSPQYNESMLPLHIFQYFEPSKIPVYLTVSLSTNRVTYVSEIGNKRENISSECRRLNLEEAEYLKRLQLPSVNQIVCQYTYKDEWIPQISQQVYGCPNVTAGAEFRRVGLALQDYFTEHELVLMLSSRHSYKAITSYKQQRSSILPRLMGDINLS